MRRGLKMDWIKLQMEWLKKFDKIKYGPFDDKYTAITTDSYMVYIIPNSELKLDLRKIKAVDYFKDLESCKDVELNKTNTVIEIEKIKAREFKDAAEQKTYINDKFLKPFEKIEVKYFKSDYKNSCVFIIDKNDVLLAAVMPIRINSEEIK